MPVCMCEPWYQFFPLRGLKIFELRRITCDPVATRYFRQACSMLAALSDIQRLNAVHCSSLELLCRGSVCPT